MAAALLSACAHAAPAEAAAPAPAAGVTAARAPDGDGWDVTLPNGIADKLTDQMWLVIDGKPEGMGGGDYLPQDAPKALRYYVHVDSDLDGQVKDILTAQGVLVKRNVTTYHVTYGVGRPVALSRSETLHFRHEAYALVFVPLPPTATYKVGDKITLFDAVALDSGVTMRDALGPNKIEAGKYARLPNDLVHRITIQVQFLPKPIAGTSKGRGKPYPYIGITVGAGLVPALPSCCHLHPC